MRVWCFFFFPNQESNFTFESKSCGKVDELFMSKQGHEKRFTHSTWAGLNSTFSSFKCSFLEADFCWTSMRSVAGKERSCLLQCSLCARLAIKDLIAVPQKGIWNQRCPNAHLKIKIASQSWRRRVLKLWNNFQYEIKAFHFLFQPFHSPYQQAELLFFST